MSKSVGSMDRLLNTYAIAALEERGDARSTWKAIAICIEEGIDFPPWVFRYFAATAERIDNHLVNRDERHPQRLKQVLGLDQEWKPETYDRKRDPEEVYEVIETWRTDGEVKTVAEGARRYREELLGRIGEPETVRGLYYTGERLSKLSMYERSARKRSFQEQFRISAPTPALPIPGSVFSRRNMPEHNCRRPTDLRFRNPAQPQAFVRTMEFHRHVAGD